MTKTDRSEFDKRFNISPAMRLELDALQSADDALTAEQYATATQIALDTINACHAYIAATLADTIATNHRSDDDTDYIPSCTDLILALTNACISDYRSELPNLLDAIRTCSYHRILHDATSAICLHQTALDLQLPESLNLSDYDDCPHDAHNDCDATCIPK